MQTDMIAELEAATDAAVDRAGTNANVLWLREADATVAVLCKIGDDFTTDDVWRILTDKGVETHEPRAMGAVMRKKSKEGFIRPAGYTRKTLRRSSHRRPLEVWRPVGRKTREAE